MRITKRMRSNDMTFELMHGDCLELMKDIPDKSVDMILCDLPYGTTVCKWDTLIPFEPLWYQYKRIIKNSGAILLFGVEPFSSHLRISEQSLYRYDWTWKHNRAVNFAQAPYMPLKVTENVSVFSIGTIAQNSKNRMPYNPIGLVEINKVCHGKKSNDHRPSRTDQKPYVQNKTGYPTTILEFDKVARPVHPTQKPVDLLEYLIKTYTVEGDTVLDNTMGSGSTGVACVSTNRNFIGIELDDKYFEIARQRIESQMGKIDEAYLSTL